MRFAHFVLGLLLAMPAAAQDWASHEYCIPQKIQVSDETLAPSKLDDLSARASLRPNSRGRLWEISKPDGTVSHLWGTYHSSDPRILNLPVKARELIGTARVVAIETDFTHQDRASIRRSQLYEGWFKDGTDAWNFALLPENGIADLGPEISDWIKDRFAEIGYADDPELYLSNAGMVELLLIHPCLDFTNGIIPIQDDYIQTEGRIAGAKILSLETRQQFMSDVNGDDDLANAIIAVYASYLKPPDETQPISGAGIGAYLQGRIGLLQEWEVDFQTSIHGDRASAYLDRADEFLLEKRNNRFIETALSELNEGGVFIAVGAFHLPGETGMVELLRKEGFDVTRIPLPGEVE